MLACVRRPTTDSIGSTPTHIYTDALAGAGNGRGPGSRIVVVQNAAWVFMGTFVIWIYMYVYVCDFHLSLTVYVCAICVGLVFFVMCGRHLINPWSHRHCD
jgi:hypothetical protein